jgi:hypothetical protein
MGVMGVMGVNRRGKKSHEALSDFAPNVDSHRLK